MTSVVEDLEAIARSRLYEEWLAERELGATLVLGGQVRYDGWGKNPRWRVLGYGKSYDAAIEKGLKNIEERTPDFTLKNGYFHAELSLQLWTPAGPRSIRIGP